MTMKKALVFGVITILLSGLAWAGGIRLAAKASYFTGEDSNFRDVYGGAVKFGLEAGLDIGGNFSLWASADTLHKTGKLTHKSVDFKAGGLDLGGLPGTKILNGLLPI